MHAVCNDVIKLTNSMDQTSEPSNGGTCRVPEPCCLTVAQAARNGHCDEMQHLLHSGHPVDVADNRGWRPLHEAAAGNYARCLAVILQHEAVDVNWQSFDGTTALALAAAEGHASCMQLLLQHGADVNLSDCMQDSPLLCAVRQKNIECVSLILEQRNVDVNCQNYVSTSPLHAAVAAGLAEITTLLLGRGARVDTLEDMNITPVFTAAQACQHECLRLLLHSLSSSGLVGASYASANSSVVVLMRRIQEGQLAVVNTCAEDGASPLFLAAQEGDVNCVRLLLERGADANLATSDPVALPLHAALQFNNVDCVEALLPVTDHRKLSTCTASPYYFSMMHKDVRTTNCLISAEVDFNAGFEAVDDDEYQPKVLRYFNSEIRYGRCFSPLVFIALYEYSVQQARVLLDAGACPDARRPCRVPPLLPALDMFNLELVECLVAAGAAVNVYHRRVAGNMSLIVCLHFWRGLDLMLRCGAEPETLFGRPRPPGSVAADDWYDDDCTDDYENEFGTLTTPVLFWRILAEAQYIMTRRGTTTGIVLRHLLQFTGSVRLDARLANYVNSKTEFQHLKAIAESPRTLAHLCRLQIRRCFTSQQLLTDDAVLSLPLPTTILDYLLYSQTE